jgi:L-2-hydroxyglutarate oxidase
MAGESVIIIGGGLVGLAAAYKLLLARPGLHLVLLEKEPAVACHQSGNNSGVLHAGLYYQPGSLKARLAVSGIRQMTAFCAQNAVPHEICGKLVLATREAEVPRLRTLLDRGRQNGLSGLEWIEGGRIREFEPHAVGRAAVRVPQEGIVDYRRVATALVGRILERGGKVMTSTCVQGLNRAEGRWAAHTSAGRFDAGLLINCAGLHSDRIARLAGERSDLRIVPFRGEYYRLRPDREFLVRNLIYPVPDPGFPFLGVHFTRLVQGGIEAGPNAVLAFAREGYRKLDFSLRDFAGSLAFAGLWRFLARYPGMCWSELCRSFSRDRFCRALQQLVPAVKPRDLVPGGAGVRAQAMLPSGELVNDFHFLEGLNALHVLNAPSPGATASLAIGDEIAARALRFLGMSLPVLS